MCRRLDVVTMGAEGARLGRELTLFRRLRFLCEYYQGPYTPSYHVYRVADGLVFTRTRPDRTHDEATDEVWLNVLIMFQMLRSAGGPGWRPQRIETTVLSEPPATIASMFPNTSFGRTPAGIAIFFPTTMLSAVFDDVCSDHHTDQRHGMADDIVRIPGDFGTAALAFVRSLISVEAPTVDMLAEEAGLSRRSAQRRLQDTGTSFSELVGKARFLAARQLMQDASVPLDAVADLVGYADRAHFNRAFRRWTGMPPSAYRRALNCANAPIGAARERAA
ncbi:MAG: helix-turn-helix transcriptional regulator [Pseudomonadota bacterium]